MVQGEGNSRKSSYIPTLDGWRAISIGLVIVSHLVPDNPVIVALGPLGVSIFFAISGYLICTLLLQERARNGRISLAGFYARRAFRILPPAVAYLTVVLALSLATLPDVLRCLLFAANYFEPAPAYLGHFWSLSIEEHFYMLWPAVLALSSDRRAATFAGVGVAAVLAWREWALTHLSGGNFYHRTDTRLDAFFAPCALAIILHSSAQWKERLRRWLTPAALVGLVGLVCASYLASRGSARVEAVQKTVQSMALPLIVLGTVLNPLGYLGRFLEAPPLRLIGRLSYSLYLWQEIFVPPRLHWPAWLRVGAALGAAAVSYSLIEQPSIRMGAWLRRRSATRRALNTSVPT
ncbi:MAG: acyltransferase [Bryobacteraceae bacterium]